MASPDASRASEQRLTSPSLPSPLFLAAADHLMTSSSLSLALAAIFVGFTATAAFLSWLAGRLPPLRMWPDLSSLEAMLPIFTVLPVMTNAFICHYNGGSTGHCPLTRVVPGSSGLLATVDTATTL